MTRPTGGIKNPTINNRVLEAPKIQLIKCTSINPPVEHHIKIAIAPIPNNGIGEAINERLARAAAPRNVPTIEQNGQKT